MSQQKVFYTRQSNVVFDGKRMRKAVQRRTVDYFNSLALHIESRSCSRDGRELHLLQPDVAYYPFMRPPVDTLTCPSSTVTTKFIHTSTNKVRCPIFCIKWTREGRRLVSGASSGEFTFWNGLTFNFETILQAHQTAIRCMAWSHNDNFMISGDHNGVVKYWEPNMNNLKEMTAHQEAIRALSFSPTDLKFASCSDDGTIKIWDFSKVQEERVLTGHRWDVKCLDWHPTSSLLISGSKDNMAILWDAKNGQNLATLHGHKNTVLTAQWNRNGNWVMTTSRDQLLRLFDIRMMRELHCYKGHKKEVTSFSWHPVHEKCFVSGGSDGSIMFWDVGNDAPLGCIETAHESAVWALDYHPLGHLLCSGSNDHTCKFWARNRPGDNMTDKYNLNTNDGGSEEEDDHQHHRENNSKMDFVVPGLGSIPNPPPSNQSSSYADSSFRSRNREDSSRSSRFRKDHGGNFHHSDANMDRNRNRARNDGNYDRNSPTLNHVDRQPPPPPPSNHFPNSLGGNRFDDTQSRSFPPSNPQNWNGRNDARMDRNPAPHRSQPPLPPPPHAASTTHSSSTFPPPPPPPPSSSAPTSAATRAPSGRDAHPQHDPRYRPQEPHPSSSLAAGSLERSFGQNRRGYGETRSRFHGQPPPPPPPSHSDPGRSQSSQRGNFHSERGMNRDSNIGFRSGDPRVSEGRMSDPRMSDPRMSDPRMSDPRMSDPRNQDPRMLHRNQDSRNTGQDGGQGRAQEYQRTHHENLNQTDMRDMRFERNARMGSNQVGDLNRAADNNRQSDFTDDRRDAGNGGQVPPVTEPHANRNSQAPLDPRRRR